MKKLTGKKVAIIATDGFEYSELVDPANALKSEGAIVEVIAPHDGEIKGWKDGHWSLNPVHVTHVLGTVNALEYDALVLPGGVINPDAIRTNELALAFVQSMMLSGKPIAAICHGPQILINAEVVRGREMTSFESIRKDLENAGAIWKDEAVVVDNGLVTSRNPDDLPAFCSKLIEEVLEGKHNRVVAA